LKSKLLSTSFIWILSLLVAGCDGKLSPRQSHDQSVEPGASSGSKPTGTADLGKSLELDRTNTESRSAFVENNKSAYLKLENWQNLNTQNSAQFKDLINQVHQEQLALAPEKRWKELPNFLLNVCDAKLENCRFIEALATSSYTSPLMMELGNAEKDQIRKFKFYALAFETANRNPSAEMLKTFLKEYAKIDSAKAETELQFLSTKFELIQSYIYNKIQAGSLQMDAKDVPVSLKHLNSADENMLSFGGRFVSDSLIQQKIQENAKAPTSYAQRMQWLETSNAGMVKQFEVGSIQQDVYFLVIDQLLSDNWTTRQATAFVQGAKLKAQKFEKPADQYIRNQLLYIMGRSQYQLSQHFQLADKRTSKRFFEDGKKSLLSEFKLAQKLSNQVRKLVEFIGQNTNDQYVKEYFNRMSQNLNRSIRTGLTNPITFALLDIGLRMGVSPTARVEISRSILNGVPLFEVVIQAFLRGEMIPLLDYSDELDPPTPFEVLEGLEFAVKSGAYESVQSNADDALTRLLDLILQSNALELYKSGSTWNLPSKIGLVHKGQEFLNIIDSTKFVIDFKDKCASLATGQHTSSWLGTLEDLAQSPAFGIDIKKMRKMSNLGIGSETAGGMIVAGDLGFFPGNVYLMDMLEWYRMDLVPLMQRFTIVSESAEKSGIQLPKLKAKIASLRQQLKNFAEGYKTYFHNNTSCWFKLFEYDRFLITEIFKYERIFWSKIHQDRAQHNTLVREFTKGIPDLIQYRSNISGDTVQLFSIDFLLRARTYLMFGMPSLGLPALAPNMNIQVPAALSKSNLYTDSPTRDIPFSSDSAEFVTNAFRNGGITKKSGLDTVEWMTSSYVPISEFGLFLVNVATNYRVSKFLEQTLDVRDFFSLDQLVNYQETVFNFISMQPAELDFYQTFALRSRYNFDMSHYHMHAFIYSNRAEWVPYGDTILKSLSGQFMGKFGDKDRDAASALPSTFMAWEMISQMLYQTMEDRRQGKVHSFDKYIHGSEKLVEFYTQAFQNDTQLLTEAADRTRTLKPIEIYTRVDEKVSFEPYSASALNDLIGTAESFHTYTGNVFKTKSAKKDAKGAGKSGGGKKK
jgi:hypothetical protein